jgi:uncharacterized repeat protein (TIGR01451 family)
MASFSFTLNGASTGTPSPQPIVTVTITENLNGSLTFVISQSDAATLGDISGFWFDIVDETLIGSLSAVSLPSPTGDAAIEPQQDFVAPPIVLTQGNDNQTSLGGGVNLEGVGYGSDGGFDVGVLYDSQPDRIDNYNTVSFTLSSSSRALAINDFMNVDFAIRLQATGADLDSDTDGDGVGSWKILGTSTPSTPDIEIDKVTVYDTEAGDGISVLSGESITWRYTVTNDGNVALANVAVTDDEGVTPTYLSGDDDSDGLLDLDEAWIFEATGYAVAGAYDNVGTATGTYGGQSVSDDDPSSYFGADPQIMIDKVTVDETLAGDGISVLSGESIAWRYTVTNAGNVALSDVTVTDDQGVMPVLVSGDLNTDGLLDLDEAWIFEATGTAIAGDYSNTGTASGSYTDDAGHTRSDTDDDTSSYFGADPQIMVDKVTVYDTVAGDGISVLSGESIAWRYTVTNAGNVALSDVTVTDDQGVMPVLVSGDNDSDGLLDLDEAWIYEAMGTAIAGDYSNTGTASGSYTDDADHTRSDTDDDPSSYFGADPQIMIDKVTVDDTLAGDGISVLFDDSITWRYTVTNVGNVALSDVTVTDDQGVMPVFVSGDNNSDGLLDLGETWIYEATGTAIVGDYSNTGTASGSYTDSAGQTRTDTETDDSSYFGLDPHINIEKLTNGVESAIVRIGDAITWSYTVTNTGNTGLSNVTIVDDNGTAASADDITLDYFDLVSGDLDDDQVLDTTETWLFESTGTATVARYTNTATVSGDVTDDAGHVGTANDTDTSSYLAGPGVRTPGFWGNLGLQFWDGKVGFTKVGPDFPSAELAPIGPSATTYLILGGDHDNTLEAGELQVSLKDALALINASQKQQQDARWMLTRDAIATELNIRAGNPGTDTDPETVDPQHLLDDAVAWLIATTSGDQTLTTAELTKGTAVSTNSSTWSSPYLTIDHAASVVHYQLDTYNNTGFAFGVQFANDPTAIA